MSNPLRHVGISYFEDSKNDKKWLSSMKNVAHVQLFGFSSRTTLHQTFQNPSSSSAIKEAAYVFPLYEGATVVGFEALLGERKLTGVVKEKEEAKAAYTKAVESGTSAALLVEHSSDVFSTSLGHIPANSSVVVTITYLTELKHDSDVDAIRLIIPTTIANRYGPPLPGLQLEPEEGKLYGLEVYIQIEMPHPITSLTSPTHPISVQMGSHSFPANASPLVLPTTGMITEKMNASLDPKKALVSLALKEANLESDFILLVHSPDSLLPSAFLERWDGPETEEQRTAAIMVSLIPRFSLPSISPEVVFIVDRSGSMEHSIPTLIASLRIFLKSLPVGVKFNICSFGSTFAFLWERSKDYNADSLVAAENYVASFHADMGGTEILPPITAVFEKRYPDLPLEILLLTDGEVWNIQELLSYVTSQTEKGIQNGQNPSRFFTLGLGNNVSHALVEGLARSGNGCCQTVTDIEAKGGLLQTKVVRMLKASLSPHVHNFCMEINPPPPLNVSPDQNVEITNDKSNFATSEKNITINLFDKSSDPDRPIQPGKFDHLPKVKKPAVLQLPFQLPSLFPFQRLNAYFILPFIKDYTPMTVTLKGSYGKTILSLDIPVTLLPEKGKSLHQLATRVFFRDLEESRSFLQSRTSAVDPLKNEGMWSNIVAREGVQMGLKYGVSSKWTSFVALDEANQTCLGGGGFEEEFRNQNVRLFSSSIPRSAVAPKIDSSRQFAQRITLPHSPIPTLQCSMAPGLTGFRQIHTGFSQLAAPNMTFASSAMGTSGRCQSQLEMQESMYDETPIISAPKSFSIENFEYEPRKEVRNKTVDTVVSLQTFEGYWELNQALVQWTTSQSSRTWNIEDILKMLTPRLLNTMTIEESKRILATVLAVAYLNQSWKVDPTLKETLELILEKANTWLSEVSRNHPQAVDELRQNVSSIVP